MVFIWVILSGGPPKLADVASDKLPPPSKRPSETTSPRCNASERHRRDTRGNAVVGAAWLRGLCCPLLARRSSFHVTSSRFRTFSFFLVKRDFNGNANVSWRDGGAAPVAVVPGQHLGPSSGPALSRSPLIGPRRQQEQKSVKNNNLFKKK